ncbi:diguanylate cyclase (GGDEF) domain-containing protein [Desulfuromusa kysingii]|uniref:Diguanylate cyclase (GGDEF) domain-containing protein n=1 Tax=Desulfuromusa kysingii TaxID=37625 RepID=A0A1H4CAX9_9BACT|nr:EAL domain-containing protein [Desulfuromusa kysingii]SEA57524.1 diguanylate cyclase (GGDEF) domain-containing protein [Desulfuromusa kysingii]
MKRLFYNLSLRGKLTFITTLTCCLMLLLTLVVVIAMQRVSLRNELLQDGQMLARNISDNCVAALSHHDPQAAALVLEPLTATHRVIGARLFDQKQTVVAQYDRHREEDPEIDEPTVEPSLPRGYDFFQNYLDILQPVVSDGQVLGQLLLRVDMAQINDVLTRYLWVGGIVFIVYSCLAFLMASGLQRLVSNPINALLVSMQTISREKDYTLRVEKNSHDELGRLFDGFNAMLAEIEVRDQELRESEANLKYLVNHDSLTKVANRSLFHDRLDHALARAKRIKSRLAILFIDLDRFKNINDSLGHDIGDLVLCVVADRLGRLVRDADTLARNGGDEFVIILDQVKKTNDVSRYVQKLSRELAKTIEVSGQNLHVSASIGVSLYPENGEEAGTLMKAADVAMYKSKNNGGDSYQFYSAEMNVDSRESLLLEHQLRDALEQKQMLLYYHPQYELKSGQLVGFEALIRWNHPELGLVSPLDFIPMAEESGLIVPIGEWVLYTACKQMKAIQDKWKLPLTMAVNLSPRQFLHPSLVQTVAEVLYRTKLKPCFLELEITESMVMGDIDQSISKMNEFEKMGVSLAIDDFGTGYSSLEYLKKFPITKLKIDQSFVRELGRDDNDSAIVNSVIALGKGLNLRVIAEGIETVEQLDLLRQEGCDEGQGYLFSKPLPVNALSALLDSVLINNPEGLTQMGQKS